MAAWAFPRGLIAELLTPLRPDGNIDEQDLQALIARVLDVADGILLAGPRGGEGRYLNMAQREELLRRAITLVKGRTALWIWVTHEDSNATRLAMERLQAVSGDYQGRLGWADTPLYHHSNRGLPAYYSACYRATGRPLLLINDPQLVKSRAGTLKRCNIRTAVLRQLAQLEGINGLVFLGPLERARNYQRAVRGTSHFRIYDGEESSFLTHPSMGGLLSVGVNLAPAAWARVSRASLHLDAGRDGLPDTLGQMWVTGQALRSCEELYHSAPAATIKSVLAAAGVISATSQEPREPEITVRLLELARSLGVFR